MNVPSIASDSPILEEVQIFKSREGSPMRVYLVFFKDNQRVVTLAVDKGGLDEAFTVATFLRRCAFIDAIVLAHDARMVTTKIDDKTKIEKGSLDDTNSRRVVSVYAIGPWGPMYQMLPYRDTIEGIRWGTPQHHGVVVDMGGHVFEKLTAILEEPIPAHVESAYQLSVNRGAKYEDALAVVLRALQDYPTSVTILSKVEI